MSETLYLFADGSCSAHPSAPDGDIGAWAVVLAGTNGYRKLLYGVDFPTTISKCELLPILNAFIFIDKKEIYKQFGTIVVISDSEFIVKTLSEVYKSCEYAYIMKAIENYQVWFTHTNCHVKFMWRERNSHPAMTICDAHAFAIRNLVLEAMKNLAGENYLVPSEALHLSTIQLPMYEDEQKD